MSAVIRTLVETCKQRPLLGALAALSVLLLLSYPIYLSVRVYVPVWTGVQPSLADLSAYYDGAQRFLDNPLALYPGPYFGYMYPPPSVVLFLPLVLVSLRVALVASLVGIVVFSIASVRLTLDLYERERGVVLDRGVRLSLLFIGLATAPVFQNLKYVQVNVLVLFLGLLFLDLVRRDRLFAAALVLSGGFWLKLYPIALALLGLRRGRLGPYAAGFAVGLVGVPLVLLPFVPLDLYRQYFFELGPYWATASNVSALVQSLPGVLAHLGQPLAHYLESYDLVVSPTIRLVNTAAALGLAGGVYAAYFAGYLKRTIAGLMLLAILPVISVLGWEYTYVLALPLYLVVLAESLRRGRGARAFTALGTLVFMVPKLPAPQMQWTFEHWPRPVVDLFYARFLPVTLLFLVVAAVWLWDRRGAAANRAEITRAPAA